MDGDGDGDGSASVPAPGLREVAQVWWDVERDPRVVWRDGGRTYVLVDPGGEGDPATGDELLLAELAHAPEDPHDIAQVLAVGLAACDFPPTGERASYHRVAATLHAARRSVDLVAP